jgi:hypothetical protein
MGQYYYPISIEKKQSICAHDYFNGLKLMEHSWIGNNFVGVVERLIAEGGSWFGTHIVWAGDYADTELDDGDMTDVNLYDMFSKNLYDMFGENKINPKFKGRKPNYRYVINMDTKQFVDKKKVPVSNTWTNPKTGKKVTHHIHPLPLLTCEGNGRGGGDYWGEEEIVGSWARNRVTVSTKKPIGYEEIAFNLK